jgi:hypothetical protein
MRVPKQNGKMTASTPTVRSVRAAQMRRESTSRPSWSVPSGWLAENPARMW